MLTIIAVTLAAGSLTWFAYAVGYEKGRTDNDMSLMMLKRTYDRGYSDGYGDCRKVLVEYDEATRALHEENEFVIYPN